MMKVTIDTSAIRNEMTVIKNEAFKALEGSNDLERKKALSMIVEKIKTLQARLSPDSTKVEVK